MESANFYIIKNNKFIVRVRQALRRGEVGTVMRRHPDRYKSASRELSSKKKSLLVKFDEDTLNPFVVSSLSQERSRKRNTRFK